MIDKLLHALEALGVECPGLLFDTIEGNSDDGTIVICEEHDIDPVDNNLVCVRVMKCNEDGVWGWMLAAERGIGIDADAAVQALAAKVGLVGAEIDG